jgi:hypothetical protein
MRRGFVIALSLCAIVVTLGCRRQYATSQVSKKETQAVSDAVQRYVQDLANQPEDVKARAPAWIKGVVSAEVLAVEKVGQRFKALVELKRTDNTTIAKYMLVGEKEGAFKVVGIL